MRIVRRRNTRAGNVVRLALTSGELASSPAGIDFATMSPSSDIRRTFDDALNRDSIFGAMLTFEDFGLQSVPSQGLNRPAT